MVFVRKWGRCIVTLTGGRSAVVALALVLSGAGCTAGPSEPDDPPAAGTAPTVAFQASAEVRGQALHIFYELVNTGDAGLTVFNRVSSGSTSNDPARVYVTGTGLPPGRDQLMPAFWQALRYSAVHSVSLST